MVTIIIPTMNRSDFLIRLLNYYVTTNYKYQIIIGDSSTTLQLEKTRKFIEELKPKLNIRHFLYPGVGISECLKLLVDRVDTPYAAILLDDDFIIGRTLEKCVAFLKSHPDYSAVGGRALLFSLKGESVYGEFSDIGLYPQRVIEGRTANERLTDHLKNYSVTLFSVHRIEAWRKMFQRVTKSSERAFMEELMPCCLSVIYGKVKYLDDLYLVRQHHRQRSFHLDSYDWITNSSWWNSYNIFHDSLAEALVQQDGIDSKKADEVIKEAFWAYLAGKFWKKYQARYGKPPLALRIKEKLKRIPGLPRVVAQIKAISPKNFSLKSLLRKQSPYYLDFMPVYRAVTTPNHR